MAEPETIKPKRDEARTKLRPKTAVVIVAAAMIAGAAKLITISGVQSELFIVSGVLLVIGLIGLAFELFYRIEEVHFDREGAMIHRRWWGIRIPINPSDVRGLAIRDIDYGTGWTSRHYILLSSEGEVVTRFSERMWSRSVLQRILARLNVQAHEDHERVTLRALRCEFPALAPFWIVHWFAISVLGAIALVLAIAFAASR